MLASAGLVAERCLRPLADELASLAVVGRKRRRGRIHRIERRVEHDDHQAGVARLLDRRHDCLGVARDDRKALGAGRDQVFDSRHLAVIVAVIFAGGRPEFDAQFLRLGLRAFAHLHKERIGLGLGDEADDVGGGCRSRDAAKRETGYRRLQKFQVPHDFLPVEHMESRSPGIPENRPRPCFFQSYAALKGTPATKRCQ